MLKWVILKGGTKDHVSISQPRHHSVGEYLYISYGQEVEERSLFLETLIRAPEGRKYCWGPSGKEMVDIL